ncbi:hypothetical protein GCM10009101_28220 [Brevundimonas lenta]
MAVASLVSAPQSDAVSVPWTLETPAIEGAIVDPTCRGSRPAEHAQCVFLPRSGGITPYFNLLDATWKVVAETSEMRIFQSPRDDGQCDFISLWLAGSEDEFLIVLRQFEPKACVT